MGHHYFIKPRILCLEQSFIERFIKDDENNGPLSLEDYLADSIQQPFSFGHGKFV